MNNLGMYDDLQRLATDVAQGRHREVIGGMWDAVGALQLDFMKRQGLAPGLWVTRLPHDRATIVRRLVQMGRRRAPPAIRSVRVRGGDDGAEGRVAPREVRRWRQAGEVATVPVGERVLAVAQGVRDLSAGSFKHLTAATL